MNPQPPQPITEAETEKLNHLISEFERTLYLSQKEVEDMCAVLPRLLEERKEMDFWKRNAMASPCKCTDYEIRDGHNDLCEYGQALRKVEDLKARPCPYVVSSEEGTHYCRLAEDGQKRTEYLEKQAVLDLKEASEMAKKLKVAVDALREIESQDYRGNRPNECVIAFKALNTLDSL